MEPDGERRAQGSLWEGAVSRRLTEGESPGFSDAVTFEALAVNGVLSLSPLRGQFHYGMIATGNHGDSDSLRGAPPSQREPWRAPFVIRFHTTQKHRPDSDVVHKTVKLAKGVTKWSRLWP